ncbi:TIGR04283 family arsenosugar biosynthesis glycosyltransferase [Flavobacteriaceae bacterium]|jgi:rSAM/selenodomain-associated transferase 2|nr:TIGR04283 family arsenosugar biosynthesis glycosyltransferase [Flavobacteriaceae bacterium]MDC3300680.1 TIGR04283 family arsenosugar biosynthesis glycosyltransferase [Flavobacteriaceae bacterium]
MNSLSVIIPVFNEAQNIKRLLDYLIENKHDDVPTEVIVVDGGSRDGSVEIVSEIASKNKDIHILKSEKGRAKQMNMGAKKAKYKILYFLHADTFPPKNYNKIISKHIGNGASSGCFKMKFDSQHWWLVISGWLTHFNLKICRGGDQSLFVTKEVFNQLNGYDESYLIYEDNDFIAKLYKHHKFIVLPHWVTSSARRYKSNGVWQLQYHFLIIHLKWYFGASAKQLENYYIKHIK